MAWYGGRSQIDGNCHSKSQTIRHGNGRCSKFYALWYCWVLSHHGDESEHDWFNRHQRKAIPLLQRLAFENMLGTNPRPLVYPPMKNFLLFWIVLPVSLSAEKSKFMLKKAHQHLREWSLEKMVLP